MQLRASSLAATGVPSSRERLGGEIHVWTARPAGFGAAEAQARYRSWLSDEERGRADRYLRADDRHLFLIAHALLRFALSHYADRAPRDWRFTAEEHGRPRIDDETATQRASFSLSHAPGLAACVISEESDCGIDVEGLGRVSDPRSVASRHFSKPENAALDRLDNDERNARFVELWTLKEAYAKARGLGLELPLDRVSFALEERGGIVATFEAPIDDQPEAWQFYHLRPHPEHVLALAVRRRRGNGNRRVVTFDVVPRG